MRLKEQVAKWEKKVATINAKIEKEVKKAFKEIEDYVAKKNNEEEVDAKKRNEAPCSVCGKKEFVLKYRYVHGKVKGKMSGTFFLFGGTVTGRIDGETDTKPVLSCRNCENERTIIIPPKIWYNTMIGEHLPSIYQYSRSVRSGSKWIEGKGAEVAMGLAKEGYCLHDTQRLYKFSKEQLKEAGLEFKYPLPLKPRWWWIFLP